MQPNPLLKTAVTVGAFAVIAVHIWLLSVIDSITLILLVVSVLPWLQPIFKTIKLPGGFEVTLQELKQEVKNATGAAQSAERKADLAVSGLTTETKNQESQSPEGMPQNRLNELARKYEEIRDRQTSGAPRTQAMTEIVREMITLASALPSLEVSPMLRALNSGQRLAAYAYLYSRPNPAYLSELVRSVTTRENKPFGQYWGLQAISRNISDTDSTKLPDSVIRDLLSYSARVPSGSDRDYEVRKILKQVTESQ